MRPHGTNARYQLGPDENDTPGRQCRCDPCRGAAKAYRRRRNQRMEPAYVSARPAREHVDWLSAQGVGLKRIVAVSGVAQGTIWKLMYGKGGNPSKRIRRETADRILAVMPSHGADGSRVPAGPTWEIIDQLVARGWQKSAIAESIGQRGPALQIGRQYVTRRNAAAIAGLLDRPVPPRRSRHGLHPVTQPEPAETTRALDDVDHLHRQFTTAMEARSDQNTWRRRSACKTKPKWVFFPARGDNETTDAAKAICATCPVKAECLAANLHERDGVWGGLSANERRALRRETAA